MAFYKQWIVPAVLASATLMSTAGRAETVQVSPYSEQFAVVASGGSVWYVPLTPGGATGSVLETPTNSTGALDGAAIADFDGDGDLDVVVGQIQAGAARADFYYFENQGSGTFKRHVIESDVPLPHFTSGHVSPMAVADFNGNGYADFVVSFYGSAAVYLFSNHGPGAFNRFVRSSLPDAPSKINMDTKAGDVNGNGHSDILLLQYNGPVWLYTNDGQGNFTLNGDVSVVPHASSGQTTVSMAVGDFTSDGHLDVVVQDISRHYNRISLHRGNGSGKFSAAISITGWGFGAESVDAYDVNNDGHLDLLIHDYDGRAGYLGDVVYWREGTGLGSFSEVRPLTGSVVTLGRPVAPVTVASSTSPSGDSDGDGLGDACNSDADVQELQEHLDLALANLDIVNAEKAALQQSLQACQVKSDELQAELDAAIATIGALNSTVDTLEAELATAYQAIAGLEDAVAGLEAELQAARQTLTAQAATITTLENEIETLTAQKAQLESQVDALQAALGQARDSLDQTLAQIEEDFRESFRDAGFTIPGATPLERQQNLADAISRLNKGRKMGLYQDLGR